MLNIPFSVQEAKKSNILLTGTNQQGKTRLAMAIADELVHADWQVIVFDNVGHWKTKSNIPNYFQVNENSLRYVLPKKESVIYDISFLLPSFQKEFVENILAELWRFRLSGKTDKQILIVFEEAHLYMRNIRSLLGQNLMRICSVGANWGIRTLAISPSLTGLDTEFIRLCQQRYHFKLGCELNSKRRFRGYYTKDWCRIAEELDVGFCIYYLNGKLQVYGIPLFESKYKPQPIRIKPIIREEPKPQPKKSLLKTILGMFSYDFNITGTTTSVTHNENLELNDWTKDNDSWDEGEDEDFLEFETTEEGWQ